MNAVGVDSGKLCGEVTDIPKDPMTEVEDGEDSAARLTAVDITNSSGGSAFVCLRLAGLI